MEAATRFRPQSSILLALQVRAMSEPNAFLTVYPAIRGLPECDSHPALASSSLAASDISTRPLRSLLKELGCPTHDWKLGRNRGCKRVYANLPRVFRDRAQVFVCGNRRGTLPAVRSTFVEHYSEARGTDQNEAGAWTNKIQRESGRYVADMFA